MKETVNLVEKNIKSIQQDRDKRSGDREALAKQGPDAGDRVGQCLTKTVQSSKAQKNWKTETGERLAKVAKRSNAWPIFSHLP